MQHLGFGVVGSIQVGRDGGRYWLGGVFHYNRDDPAVLVPRRFGIGLTLNLGNPLS